MTYTKCTAVPTARIFGYENKQMTQQPYLLDGGRMKKIQALYVRTVTICIKNLALIDFEV